MRAVSYSNRPVYRASDDTSGRRISDKDRGSSAITSGVYFGLDADAIRGYGKYLHEYKVDARKVVSVRGDRELDKIKADAKAWGQEKIEELSDPDEKLTSDLISKMVQYSSTPDVTRLYLEDQGYDGIEYLNAGAQDHHDQFVLFRESNVKQIKRLDEQVKLMTFRDFIKS